MPLIDKLSPGKNTLIGIWEVTENINELEQLYVPDEHEKMQYDSFTHVFRRSQWLASRCLLQQLHPGGKINYDENGKPRMHSGTDFISISHSGKMIALMISDSSCGIDIELIRPKIDLIAHKFLSEEELKIVNAESLTERLHAYWCIKEAIYKMNGKKFISMRTDISVPEINIPDHGEVVASVRNGTTIISANVRYEIFREHMLAYTLHSAK
ncbi:MAG: 4'-phosphopantetheinyl transferase superfamily protein [Bacteroidetes bacterium]|nr:4'-phosphopantetheinyl transferase superfamily protein [Bacteroidota bacterium]